jgi:hypothetical protein
MQPAMTLPTVARCDYQTWKLILNDSNLSRNVTNVSESFGINFNKANAIIQEYKESGCIIMQSKLNFK